MATYKDIADFFISLSNATGSLITNLKLQKLMYYAQAWHLAVFKEPIFEEDFQAWIHGPVLPQLYDAYREFKWNPILCTDLDDKTLITLKAAFSENLNALLNDVVEEYFTMNGFALERSTHDEDPWILARKGFPSDMPSTNIIEKDSMINYYTQFVV